MPRLTTDPISSEHISAYQGPYTGKVARQPNGAFDHFETAVSAIHLQNGYWKFQSIKDDQRAHKQGFTTPEDVLLAQNHDDEKAPYEDISLQWIPGSKDHNLKRLKARISGSASKHLQTLAELRIALGKPLALRGQVPIYPTGDDDRLRVFWESRFRQRSTSRLASEASQSVQPTSSPRQSIAAPNLNRTPTQQQKVQHKPQIPSAPASTSKDTNGINFVRQTSPIDDLVSKAFPLPSTSLEAPRIDSVDVDKPSGRQSKVGSEGRGRVSGRSEVIAVGGQRIGDTWVANRTVDTSSPESQIPGPGTTSYNGHASSALPQSPSFEPALMATSVNPILLSVESIDTLDNNYSRENGLVDILPCMDCGELRFHRSDCNIAHIMEEPLTSAKLTSLAEATEHFDPGPWTSYYEPLPEVELLDGANNLKNKEEKQEEEDLDFREDDENSIAMMRGLSPECIAREAAILSWQLQQEYCR